MNVALLELAIGLSIARMLDNRIGALNNFF
jgi:hypothetical protein